MYKNDTRMINNAFIIITTIFDLLLVQKMFLEVCCMFGVPSQTNRYTHKELKFRVPSFQRKQCKLLQLVFFNVVLLT